MAFKSVAQRNRALRMMDAGEISAEKFREWDAGTPEELPDRLHPKKEKKGAAEGEDGSAGWLPTPGPEDMG
jgi:hypothetical protein